MQPLSHAYFNIYHYDNEKWLRCLKSLQMFNCFGKNGKVVAHTSLYTSFPTSIVTHLYCFSLSMITSLHNHDAVMLLTFKQHMFLLKNTPPPFFFFITHVVNNCKYIIFMIRVGLRHIRRKTGSTSTGEICSLQKVHMNCKHIFEICNCWSSRMVKLALFMLIC
jgi:hypothetical protein